MNHQTQIQIGSTVRYTKPHSFGGTLTLTGKVYAIRKGEAEVGVDCKTPWFTNSRGRVEYRPSRMRFTWRPLETLELVGGAA